MPKFTLAISIYNNHEFIIQDLERYMQCESINEIIVLSNNHEVFSKLYTISHPKIPVFILTNEKKLNIIQNNTRLLNSCKEDWVLLLDSCNRISNDVLKILHNYEIKDQNTVIAPSFLKPNFNYKYLGNILDLKNWINMSSKDSDFWNTGNYLVPKSLYNKASEHLLKSNKDLGIYNIIYINYFLVNQLNAKFINLDTFEYDNLFLEDDKCFIQFLADAKKTAFDKFTKIWKPSTAMVNPPFKKGRYLEEYFSQYYTKNKIEFDGMKFQYIDILWTNIYCNKLCKGIQFSEEDLQKYIDIVYPEDPNIKYFTVVQYADGVLRKIPKGAIVFSAGGVGDIKLPLIYEDTSEELKKHPKLKFSDKTILCSFVGKLSTFKLRDQIYGKIKNIKDFSFHIDAKGTQTYKDVTSKSKFSLAPRGYGRSSFRFWEVYLLGSIPVYIYDDICWLPFQDEIDYDKIAIVLHINEIDKLETILTSIDEIKYQEMWNEYNKIKEKFTLEGMCNTILQNLKKL